MESKKIEIKEYISSHINIFVEPLVYNIVKARPPNPVAFAINWLKDYAEKNKKIVECDSQDDEDQKQDMIEFEAKLLKKKAQGKSRSRMAISEEVFGNFNKKEHVELLEIPKDHQTTLLIKSLIRNSILFQNIDSKDQETLIKAMSEKLFEQGDAVISQGDSGDQLFVVESGEYDCFKVIDGSKKYLKTYCQGQAFGELSLMYNTPRAASIVCKSPGKVYCLDRITFSQIVKQASLKKRELFKSVIEKIDAFSSINAIQKEQFLDILKEEKYEAGQYIIKQGEQGNKFYIVLEGQLIAEKLETSYELPRVVYKYKQGEYFGQLALVHDVCRQASVKALSQVRVAYLDRESFKRIFGSMEDMLKKNEEKYCIAEQGLICT